MYDNCILLRGNFKICVQLAFIPLQRFQWDWVVVTKIFPRLRSQLHFTAYLLFAFHYAITSKRSLKPTFLSLQQRFTVGVWFDVGVWFEEIKARTSGSQAR